MKARDPRHVGVYRLLGRLGRGGMGQVFLGESRGARKVAVKVIRPEYADDPEFRTRFAREVDAARRVGGFHTAAVVDADPDADPPWMVTEYVPGPSLLAAVEEHGPLPAPTVSALGAALTDGLAAIHRCGLIHRDLKPGNVILAADGPRIIDFGIAKSTGAPSITQTGIAIGSFQYMSPEQVSGAEIGYESDIFSLGSLLTFAATGRSPFDASDERVVMARIIGQPPDLGDVTGPLRDIISACLAKDPARRPDPDRLLASLAERRQPTVAPGAAAGRGDGVDPHQEPRARDSDPGSTLQRSLVSVGHRLEAHDAEIRLVSFSPDGQFLATAAADWSLCVWDAATWHLVAQPAFCDNPEGIPVRGFRQLVFTPDSRTVLATRESDSVVWRLEADTGKLTPHPIAGPRPRWAPRASVLAPVLAQDGRYALCYNGVNLILSDIAAEKSVTLSVYPHAIGGLFGDASFAVGGDLVGVVDNRQRIHLWNTSTTSWVGKLEPPQELEGSTYRVKRMILSDQMAAAICDVGDGANARALYQWNLADAKPHRPRLLDDGHDGRLVRIGLAPDGKTLTTIASRGNTPGDSGGDVMVSLWDTTDGTRTDLAGGCYEVPRLIFSRDGRLLVTMVASLMRLWDLRGEQPAFLGERGARFGDPLNDGAWSPNSRTLVTAEGRAARVWQRSRS